MSRPPFPGGQPEGNSNDGPGQGGEDNQGASWPRWGIAMVALAFLVILVISLVGRPTGGDTLETNEFFKQLDDKKVENVTIDTQSFDASGTLKNGESFTSNVGAITDELNSKLVESGTEFEYVTEEQSVLANLLFLLLPVMLLIGAIIWLNRRAQGQMGSIMQIGKSKAKVYTSEKPSTTFDDVAGHSAPKQEIKEVVSFLKEPKKFKELGAKVPKGVLLVGPPGTGKTLLARAVAGEAGVPFIAVTGSDFMEMFVGVGASRVRDLFNGARKQAPAVIFIDEIDSIGRKRGAGLGGGHDEREQTLNQLLSEMDGFEGAEGIVMMAATNRPDILDPALLRPGRFDRQIVVPLPTLSERKQILAVHIKDKKVEPELDLEFIAKGTPGFSGADLANLTNEAALYAVRAGHKMIERSDFDSARDRVMMGVERDSLAMSDGEKRVTAYHEGGHALCGAVTDEADEIHKVTILPVGMALGVTQFLPEERHIEPRERVKAQLVVALGGRAAEEVVFNAPTTGAQNDLVQATKLARKMVKEWGMSEKLGPVAYGGDSEMVFLGDEIARGHEYSEQTARVIDEEVTRIVDEARREATRIVTEHRPALDMIAEALLENEAIDGADVVRMVNEAETSPGIQTSGVAEAEPPAPVEPAPSHTIDTAPGREHHTPPAKPNKGILGWLR